MSRGGPLYAIPGGTLDSWKAIAAYLRRDVRTVVRWERARGLPVHRVPGGGRAGVFALKSELDEWWNGARQGLIEERPASTPSRQSPSIAVLPFMNLSSAKDNEYFSDGLADEIITLLTRVQGLRVTARTSSFFFRGHAHDVRAIGRKLGVSTILEGSVQRLGRRVRVSAQLVDAINGFHLWSEQYDRKIGDVFAIEDEISHAIAGALEVRLAPSPALRPIRNQEAYNWWLKGRYYQQYETLEAFATCRDCLKRAIALDPLFPQPYLGLASVVRAAVEVGMIGPLEALAEGRAAIQKALDLDGSLGEAHALSGAYRAWMDFDWGGAAADFKRALALTPVSAEAHTFHATHYLAPTGRLLEAEEALRQAILLDPVSPMAHIEVGKVLLWMRRFDEAGAAMEAAFELRPDYWLGAWFRGVAFYFQGRIGEALACWQSVQKRVGATPVGTGAIGMALGQLGRHSEARAALADLDAAERRRYVPRSSRALIHMGLGETDTAFEWLDRAVEERDIHILDLPCKPVWDALRSDPRFTALLRKMRLG